MNLSLSSLASDGSSKVLIFRMLSEQDKHLQQQQQQQLLQYVHHIFHLLPTLTCWSPTDSLDINAGRTHGLT